MTENLFKSGSNAGRRDHNRNAGNNTADTLSGAPDTRYTYGERIEQLHQNQFGKDCLAELRVTQVPTNTRYGQAICTKCGQTVNLKNNLVLKTPPIFTPK